MTTPSNEQLEGLLERLSRDMDDHFISMLGGQTTNSTRTEEPPVTAESIMASIKGMMADLPPPPPRIIQSEYLVDRVEDWSRVRSHGRATRRRKQGKQQNIVIIETPKPDAYQIDGKIYVHPVTWARALSALKDQSK